MEITLTYLLKLKLKYSKEYYFTSFSLVSFEFQQMKNTS